MYKKKSSHLQNSTTSYQKGHTCPKSMKKLTRKLTFAKSTKNLPKSSHLPKKNHIYFLPLSSHLQQKSYNLQKAHTYKKSPNIQKSSQLQKSLYLQKSSHLQKKLQLTKSINKLTKRLTLAISKKQAFLLPQRTNKIPDLSKGVLLHRKKSGQW